LIFYDRIVWNLDCLWLDGLKSQFLWLDNLKTWFFMIRWCEILIVYNWMVWSFDCLRLDGLKSRLFMIGWFEGRSLLWNSVCFCAGWWASIHAPDELNGEVGWNPRSPQVPACLSTTHPQPRWAGADRAGGTPGALPTSYSIPRETERGVPESESLRTDKRLVMRAIGVSKHIVWIFSSLL